ncbi:AIPR family protein [Roseomonas gilardii]|uniref:AIPR family protein n=1 Tax=Roseomonas gilardii TaxID=257708 RepID=A0ABU3MLS8_9PROT|nr:AIPR family protein [Roseomonas gilardii]MDT8333983.1 AIPR family protein [Roseomonas gilardii]
MAVKAKGKAFAFPYSVCRNISSPDDDAAGRKIYSGHAPASSVLPLEDNENVREYLVDAKGKQKRSPTLVHQAIRKTLSDNAAEFCVLNGGMTIVANTAEVDDKARVITLTDASIINGSQTQGELLRYFDQWNNQPPVVPYIKFEIIVTDDANLTAEISIARNFQNDVRAISIAGRRGQLDDLEQAVAKARPGAKLRKSETDLTGDGGFLDTEKLIQVTMAVMPEAMLKKLDVASDAGGRTFTYSQKTRCLKVFQRLVEDGPADVYACFLDLAPKALDLYDKWKSHQGFKGTRIRSITRDNGEIIEVPDGVVFPILAAHAAFAKLSPRGWDLKPPKVFTDSDIIGPTKQAYMEIAGSNPQTMGKSKACYSNLAQITSIYAKLG